MEKTIEIKAMKKEVAIERALKILEATSEDIINVLEKEKAKSFLGLFNKEGVYSITIDKDRKRQTFVKVKEEQKENKEIKKEINREVNKEEVVEKNIPSDKSEIILEKTRILLQNMNLDLEAKVEKEDGRNYKVDLYGDDNGIIIGKKGKTLNSFEYLLNTLIRECRIDVNVEGFKEKRDETLRELGKKMAEKAVSTGKTIRLNPMPPRERKIIHEIINQYESLDTFSEGKDPKRYIVIKRKK